jgi:hypothetical protein
MEFAVTDGCSAKMGPLLAVAFARAGQGTITSRMCN